MIFEDARAYLCYLARHRLLEGSLATPVLSDCTTSAAERVMCYLMDLWGRLCLAIGRGLAPRTELSISCVTNEARACHQCNTYRAPASATSTTKRERACKHPESRNTASQKKRELYCKKPMSRALIKKSLTAFFN